MVDAVVDVPNVEEESVKVMDFGAERWYEQVAILHVVRNQLD